MHFGVAVTLQRNCAGLSLIHCSKKWRIIGFQAVQIIVFPLHRKGWGAEPLKATEKGRGWLPLGTNLYTSYSYFVHLLN